MTATTMIQVFNVPLTPDAYTDVMSDDSTRILGWHDPKPMQEGRPYLIWEYQSRPFWIQLGAGRMRYLMPYRGDVTELRPLDIARVA